MHGIVRQKDKTLTSGGDDDVTTNSSRELIQQTAAMREGDRLKHTLISTFRRWL